MRTIDEILRRVRSYQSITDEEAELAVRYIKDRKRRDDKFYNTILLLAVIACAVSVLLIFTASGK